jgi:hypothetical protein
MFVVPVQGTIDNIPSNFNLSFKGVQQDEKQSFVIVFNNGSSTVSKNLGINFSMTHMNNDAYSVYIKVDLDNSSSALTLNASVLKGQLMVNSVSSIFKLNPDSLKQGVNVVLAETPDWTISGIMKRIGKPETAIGSYRIEALYVECSFLLYSANHSMYSSMCFDPDTGLFVNAFGTFSDILLNKIGIAFIIGGLFDLASYSENLNFNLINISTPGSGGFDPALLVVPLSLIFLSVLTVIIYRTQSKRKNYRKYSSKNNYAVTITK